MDAYMYVYTTPLQWKKPSLPRSSISTTSMAKFPPAIPPWILFNILLFLLPVLISAAVLPGESKSSAEWDHHRVDIARRIPTGSDNLPRGYPVVARGKPDLSEKEQDPEDEEPFPAFADDLDPPPSYEATKPDFTQRLAKATATVPFAETSEPTTWSFKFESGSQYKLAYEHPPNPKDMNQAIKTPDNPDAKREKWTLIKPDRRKLKALFPSTKETVVISSETVVISSVPGLCGQVWDFLYKNCPAPSGILPVQLLYTNSKGGGKKDEKQCSDPDEPSQPPVDY